MQRFRTIPIIEYFLRHRFIMTLEVGSVLNRKYVNVLGQSSLRRIPTLVAINNWSLIPRASAHSPINISDDSSWLWTPLECQHYISWIIYLLTIRSINEVSSIIEIGVKEFEAGFLIHTSESRPHPPRWPFITNTHSSQLDRRYMYTSIGG